MTDAISRRELLKELERLEPWDDKYAAIDVVEGYPALDAVPVVRCGDCRWYDSAFYACSKCGVCVNRDFYCANGEKES